ncbi:MAG: hypothetical protein K2V38_02695, partial [Gemmataceae bacterium]|nr:hypothetical protein [Gemmataceae bacterium]
MSERVFCIDFGSAYTKVALRRDPSAPAELIQSTASRTEDLDFCVPSLALIDRTVKPNRPEFGPGVVGRQAGNGIELYRNWKRYLFTDVAPTGEPAAPPLDALLRSDQLLKLAESFGVMPAQIGQLQQIVASARALLGVVTPRGTSEAQYRTFATNLAVYFFRWLRQQVMDACSRLRATGLNPETIPVRITVPAFAHG